MEAKAARLLSSGAVTVRHVDEDTGALVAEVAGDTGIYRMIRQPTGRWSRSGPAGAHRQPCAHLTAVWLISGEMP